MLLSLLPLPHSLNLLLLVPDKVSRFRVRFQLLLSKRFRFLQNSIASSFRFLCFQHNTENLVCRKSVKLTA